jgi:apolipoprotein N-acyltransferase
VTAGRLSEPYFKNHLLIFGEYVPFGEVFPWLNEVFYRGTGLVAGKKQVRLDAGAIRAVALNCYEDTLSHAVREAMKVGPNLLVNLTNDAWYTGTTESEMHLRLALSRAIEVRRDMVRAVNLGETTWVDAAGRIRARYSSGEPGLLPAEPALLEVRTLYARVGDLPLLVVSAGLVAAFLWRRRAGSRPSPRS